MGDHEVWILNLKVQGAGMKGLEGLWGSRVWDDAVPRPPDIPSVALGMQHKPRPLRVCAHPLAQNLPSNFPAQTRPQAPISRNAKP